MNKKQLLEIIEQELDKALEEEEETICEDCADLEEAFVIDDEGGPMRKPQQQEQKSAEKCRVCGTKLSPSDTGYCKDCEKDAKKDYDKEQAAVYLEEEVAFLEKEIMEIFGFGKDKPVVDCEELRNQYARLMMSSAGGPQSDQLHKLRKQIKKNCPDMMGKGIHPLKRRGE